MDETDNSRQSIHSEPTDSKTSVTEVINEGVRTLSAINSLEESIVSLLKIATDYYDSQRTVFMLINENYISTQRKFEYVSTKESVQDDEEEPFHIIIDESGSVRLTTKGDDRRNKADIPDERMLMDCDYTRLYLVPVYSYSEFCGLLVAINYKTGNHAFLKSTGVLLGEVLDKNADANHRATQQFYHTFESVYIVNLDTDMYRILHRKDWVWDAKGKEVQRYTPDVGLYIDTSVHPDDQKHTHQMLDKAYIRKAITKEKKSFAFAFRDMYTGEPIEMLCRVVKVDEAEETHMVVITFRIEDRGQRELCKQGEGSSVSDAFISYEEIIPERLGRFREAKGKSARDMSLSIGQNASYINNIENGKALPSMSAFFCICDYLGVTPAKFFGAWNEEETLETEIRKKVKRLTDEQRQVLSKLLDFMSAPADATRQGI